MEKQLFQLSPDKSNQMQHKKLWKEQEAVSLAARHKGEASAEPSKGGKDHWKAGSWSVPHESKQLAAPLVNFQL